MIGYAHCGTGLGLAGCIVPQWEEPKTVNGYGLEYVMVDPGTPFPHASGLGADAEAPSPSNTELWRQLYARNRLAFWIGGSVVGLLALNGLFHVIRR